MDACVMVAWKMKVIMADKDLSVNEVGRRTGKHINTIGRWKNSKKMPKIGGDELDSLVAALECTVFDLLGEGEY